MPLSDKDSAIDPEIAQAMADLMAQTAREPVSPRLMALVRQLEAAMATARQHPVDGAQADCRRNEDNGTGEP